MQIFGKIAWVFIKKTRWQEEKWATFPKVCVGVSQKSTWQVEIMGIFPENLRGC